MSEIAQLWLPILCIAVGFVAYGGRSVQMGSWMGEPWHGSGRESFALK